MAWRTGYPSGRLLLGKAGDGDSLRNDDGDTCRGREGRDELVGAVGIALALIVGDYTVAEDARRLGKVND